VADFVRFIAVRWRVPEWQQHQAEAALRKHFGFPQEPPPPSAQAAPDPAEPRAGTAGSSAPGSTTTEPGPEAPTPRLTLAQALLKLEGAILVRHYSVRTQETYGHWLRQYWAFLQRHKQQTGFAELKAAAKVKGFLEHLAVERRVVAATQNQALNALVFFYKEVLGRPFGELGEVLRASKLKRLPEVLTVEQTRRLLEGMSGTPQLIARLLYGTGMRLMEGLRLRVKDVDFEEDKEQRIRLVA
jgi:integrase